MNISLFSIKDKIVIITGASKGIGREVSIAMAKAGALVYGIGRKFQNPVPKNLSGLFFQENCDVTNIKSFEKICSRIFKNHRKIDVLVNNAGVSYPASEDGPYPREKWDKTIEINLTAHFLCSQIVAGFMAKKGSGSIINITSLNAERAFPNNPAYVVSKGGLKMLTKSLAKDLGKYGIRVNSIGPGYIRTSLNKKSYLNKKSRKLREAHTLLKRWGEPADLVGPCIFLASEASSYITGADIYVDGGWLANGLVEL